MTKYIHKTTLKNGITVLIRFLRQTDRVYIEKGYKELSYKSQYFRFISPPDSLSDKDLKYLTEIDNDNHVAMIAFVLEKQLKHPVGVARYIKLIDNPCSAEFAITVLDSYQNKGLGTIFFNLLIDHARRNNINNLTGYILSENLPMLKIVKHHNIHIRKEEGALLRVDIPLKP
ncbi:MAG: GNAT family N-acetyltransferase [Bacteroidales bacterium]|nr:MAG: GNAT family N-acetyltransferase [Bacteroidales bacterium]